MFSFSPLPVSVHTHSPQAWQAPSVGSAPLLVRQIPMLHMGSLPSKQLRGGYFEVHQDANIRGRYVPGKPCECWNRECGGIVSMGKGGDRFQGFADPRKICELRGKSHENARKCCRKRWKSVFVGVKSASVEEKNPCQGKIRECFVIVTMEIRGITFSVRSGSWFKGENFRPRIHG